MDFQVASWADLFSTPMRIIVPNLVLVSQFAPFSLICSTIIYFYQAVKHICLPRASLLSESNPSWLDCRSLGRVKNNCLPTDDPSLVGSTFHMLLESSSIASWWNCIIKSSLALSTPLYALDLSYMRTTKVSNFCKSASETPVGQWLSLYIVKVSETCSQTSYVRHADFVPLPWKQTCHHTQ